MQYTYYTAVAGRKTMQVFRCGEQTLCAGYFWILYPKNRDRFLSAREWRWRKGLTFININQQMKIEKNNVFFNTCIFILFTLNGGQKKLWWMHFWIYFLAHLLWFICFFAHSTTYGRCSMNASSSSSSDPCHTFPSKIQLIPSSKSGREENFLSHIFSSHLCTRKASRKELASYS